ncbi:AfsR/SARP family transcriptional regulator [Kitasatospora cathayae]|uniref:BTAD domain-containing putative transcriptional regulator n=1 Tax=Kitasatospora cathayae TaxID=3004092 RepID=A0ABY7QD80_9ACTN|nr:BTAD domain-containing putative transcriptional regulator [Kitasatospora sp. HUAS 3-15]WBP90640.1 BTAD domain-containing putative transcriptional regulator [Kitasatospora sp. HUAS 3-15]
MRFSLLGPVAVRRGDRVVPVGGPKVRALLAALLLQANRAVSPSSLQGALWGEEPPVTAASSLANHVMRLRRALEAEAEDGSRLSATPYGPLLRVDEGELDVREFTGLLTLAREARGRRDWPAVSGHAGAAMALWRGRPLSDLPVLHTLEAEVRHLCEAHLQALEWYFEAELELGRHTEVTPELSRWAAEHPLHESLHVLLVTALYRGGRQAEALEVFETVRTALAEELGVDPGPALRAVHQRVLTADPLLLKEQSKEQRKARPVPEAGLVTAPPAPSAPAQLPLDATLFTGRKNELRRLRAVLEQAADGNGPGVVAVTGMGGVGKSALAVHAAHLLRDRFPDGQLHLDLRGHGTATPRTAHELLASVLTDLAVALPEDTGHRAALLRSVLAERRVLLLLDNARDSGQVLPLLPGTGHSAAIVTSRSTLTDLPTPHHLSLAPMDVEEQRALLCALCGSDRVEQDLDAALRILAACGGLPLALRIVGARLAARPAWPLATLADRLAPEGPGRLSTLAAGHLQVRATFAASYLALRDSESPGEREAARAFRLLGLWSGQTVGPADAAALLDRDPARAEELLEQLVDAHLLQTPAPLRYRLHDLLAEYAVECAEADESEQEREAARLRMCVWYALALENARLAIPEGGQLPPRLGQEPPAPLPVFTDEAQALAWCRRELAGIGEAIRQAGESRRFDLAWRMAVWLLGYMRTSWWTGHWESYLQQALDIAHGRAERHDEQHAAQHDDRLGRAWLLRSLGACHGMSRRPDRAIEAFEEALTLFDDPESQAATLAYLSVAHGAAGHGDQALTHARAALDLHLSSGGNRHRTAIFMSTMADALRVSGHLDEAELHYREAIVLWRDHGDANGTAVVLTNHGDVLRELGRRDDAFAALDEALATFRRIGNAALTAECLVTMARTHARFDEWTQGRARIHEAIDVADRHHLGSWLHEAREVHDMIELGVIESTWPADR